MKRFYGNSRGKSVLANLWQRAAIAVVLVLMMGCTQKLAQQSQNKWLKNSHSQTLYKTRFESTDGPLHGEVTTELSGFLESAAITELSGLAASHRNPDIFWAINDSGNRPELFALNRAGRHIATFTLPERNIDWEDLSSFQYQGKSWLIVADTGDNLRRRKDVVLYLLEEPLLTGSQAKFARSSDAVNERSRQSNEPKLAAASAVTRTLPVEAIIEFAYEDGPQNVESVSVSPEDGSIYMVAKRGTKSSLYELPLTTASSSERLVAKRLGNTTGLHWTEGVSWLERVFGTQFLLGPTAMDISADNKLAVIANYRHLYLYRKPADQPWSVALRGKPQIISSHRMAQSESVAFSADAKYIVVGSEGLHAPLLVVR